MFYASTNLQIGLPYFVTVAISSDNELQNLVVSVITTLRDIGQLSFNLGYLNHPQTPAQRVGWWVGPL